VPASTWRHYAFPDARPCRRLADHSAALALDALGTGFAARRGHPAYRAGDLHAAGADLLPELPLRALLHAGRAGGARRLSLHLHRSGLLARVREIRRAGLRAGGDLGAAGRHPGVPDGALRPARPPHHRADADDPGVRFADGAGVRLRGVSRPGRLLYDLVQAVVRRRAVERVLVHQHHHHRRAHARAARVSVCVVGAAQPGFRCGGSRAHLGRVAAVGGAQREPADGAAGTAVRRRAGDLPGLRSVRPGAGAGRSGRPPGAGDLPVQADQQAGHAGLSPDGGRGGLPGDGDFPAGAAAALHAALGQPLRHRQGQGHAQPSAAARQVALAGMGGGGAVVLRDGGRAAVGHRAARLRVELG